MSRRLQRETDRGLLEREESDAAQETTVRDRDPGIGTLVGEGTTETRGTVEDRRYA
jgi:hypothetical protein